MRIRLIVGICTVLFLAPQAWAESACSHVDMTWIRSLVPVPQNTRLVFKQEREGLCEVILSMNGRPAAVYAGKEFAITGSMFKKGKFLTRETIASLPDDVKKQVQEDAEKLKPQAEKNRKTFFKQHIRELESLVSFSFSPGKSGDFIYVITDPNCSHCKKLLDSLEEIAVKANLAIKVILYPVLGENSREMAAHAICGGYTYGAYRTMKKSGPFTSCEKADDILKKTDALFRPANISFVPFTIASDGSWVVEGNMISQVKANIGFERP